MSRVPCGTSTNGDDQDEMPQNWASHQGLRYYIS